MEASRVLVGTIEDGLVVKVVGRGTMEYCSQLFDFLANKIEAGSFQNSCVFFDLSEANYLDSSFIGVIVSIDKKVRKLGEGSVIILNPTDKVKEILGTMGLMEILPIQEKTHIVNIEATSEIQKKLEKDYSDIQILLESHQNLMELNVENRKRFGLVEEMLKKELEKEKEKEKNKNR